MNYSDDKRYIHVSLKEIEIILALIKNFDSKSNLYKYLNSFYSFKIFNQKCSPETLISFKNVPREFVFKIHNEQLELLNVYTS